MSHWRVSKHYGFGAAQVSIQPEAHRAARVSLAEGVADFSAEFFHGSPADVTRRILGEVPAAALGLLLMTAFLVTLLRDNSDQSAIELVFFETPPVIEVMPEPEVLPEPEPIPVARPEPEVQPKPVEILAERPPVPPKPPEATPRPRPEPVARPKPVPPKVPEIARVEKPKPLAPRPERADRRVRPELGPKPRISLDAVARNQPTPANWPRPNRVKQPTPLASRAPVPRLDAPAAPTPRLSEAPAPERAFRVAAASNKTAARRPQAMPGLAPAPTPTLAEAAAPTRTRTRVAASPVSRNTPSFAPAMAAAPAAVSNVPAPRTSAKRVERAAPQRTSSAAPRLAAAPARVPRQMAAALPSAGSRVARAVHPEATGPKGGSDGRPGVDGVPLGSLAACLSDREEDRLKQAVVRAVTTQKECVSPAGTYRFIETKNLNSFLMSIDRVSGRSVGDRCDELRLAIQCLTGS